MKRHLIGFGIAVMIFTAFAFVFGLFEYGEPDRRARPPLVDAHIPTANSFPRTVQAVAERETGDLTLIFAEDIFQEPFSAAIFTERGGKMTLVDTIIFEGSGTRAVSAEHAISDIVRMSENLYIMPFLRGGQTPFDPNFATPIVMEERGRN